MFLKLENTNGKYNFFCQVANYLKDVGVKKGDAVIVYLPMLMELPITMLACARIGAVHSVSHTTFFLYLSTIFLLSRVLKIIRLLNLVHACQFSNAVSFLIV